MQIGINRKTVLVDPSEVENDMSPFNLDHASVSSRDDGDGDDDELENEPVRLRRPSRKTDSHSVESSTMHVLNDREQVGNARHSQSRPAATNNGVRSANNVSFMSDVSKTAMKTTAAESTGPASSNQLKQVIYREESMLIA